MEKLRNFLRHYPLARFRKKFGRLLRELVPYNQKFRPMGVHASSARLAAASGGSVTYHEIVPAHVSTLHIPEKLLAEMPAYGGLHDKPDATEQVPAAFALTLPNARLYADNLNSVAVVAADDYLVGDASFQWSNKGFDLTRPEDNNIFRQRYFLPPQPVAGTVCSLLSGGGAGEGNYFHWLIDSLPRLHLVREAGLLPEVDFFLVYDKNKRFVRETLAAVGIGPERIIDVTTHRHLRAERLIVTSAVRGSLTHTPAWACEFLRDTQLPAADTTRQHSPYIYISRRDARYRHVTNEAAMEEMLHELGFETHVLMPYSQPEKTALFAQAKVIVAPVGAGLTNIVFSNPDACLIELLPRGFVVAEYQLLTARLGMGYDFLVGTDDHMSHHYRDAVFESLTVDVDALRKKLKKAMQPQKSWLTTAGAALLLLSESELSVASLLG